MTDAQDYDNPWKVAIHKYFRSFMAVLFPDIERDIDWAQPVEFLDQELAQILRRSRTGKRRADVIVKVTRRNGDPAWVIIHLEIQSQHDRHLSKRTWTYFYRLVERHALPVVSLVVLAYRSRKWRPEPHEVNLWGCELRFKFPTVKLLDLEPQLDRLLARDEPFAFVVAAHLRTLHHRSDSRRRLEFKTELTRMLYRKRWDEERIIALLDLIDWLMKLSPPLEIEFKERVRALEEEQKMPYVNSIKRLAQEEGRAEGRAEGRKAGLLEGREEGREEGRAAILRTIEAFLTSRFGAVPDSLAAGLRQVTALGELEALALRAATCESLAEFSKLVAG